MINELQKLFSTLEELGIEIMEWDSNYKELPGSDCYRIFLDRNGEVTGIELLNKEIVRDCRKYGNNQQSFPAFNVAALFRTTEDFKPDDKTDKIKELCIADNWHEKLRKKVSKCLSYEIPSMHADSGIIELMRISKNLNARSFHDALQAFLFGEIEAGQDVKALLPLLLYQGKPEENAADDTGAVSVILDLKEWRQYGYPIASKTTTEQINSWLVSSADRTTAITADQADAFGDPFNAHGRPVPMPSVRLAPGFEVSLRSMFREQTCQFRYGRADDASFPITLTNRANIKKALEWISRSESEHITWQKISQDAMLFVYPNKLPPVPVKFVTIFGGDKQNNTARFEKIAEQFIESVFALRPGQQPDNIQIFILQQILPAVSKRAKVVFTEDYTVNGLIQASKEWQVGCANFPALDRIEAITPFPLKIASIANNVWGQNGELASTNKAQANLMRYYNGMELLLNTLDKQTLMHYLRGILANAHGLVSYVGNILAQEKYSTRHQLAIGELFPLLGLLLYKSGYTKEVYMENMAFLMGQVLKMSDGLHELYCQVVRKGDVPPQLAGNGLFVSASETPWKALSQLGVRMCPYISWARQYRTKNEAKSGLAAWYLKMFEETTTKLSDKLPDTVKFNDYEKAQLFIGYLAAFPKKATENNEETEEGK